jgi:hypothetical protein
MIARARHGCGKNAVLSGDSCELTKKSVELKIIKTKQ